MLLHLVVHVIRGIIKLADDDPPERKLDPALYTRRATSILQYINIASNAMINDGKKLEDVKTVLRKRGLNEDHFEVVLNKAQQNYKIWFNENGGKPALNAFQLYEQLTRNHAATSSAIEMLMHEGENHAIQFCALINYQRYYHLNGRNLLYAITNLALANSPVLSNNEFAIRQSTFTKVGGNTNNPFLRVVTVDGNREAIFPYLRTEKETAFSTRQITEWTNGEPIVEAEVSGYLNNTFPLTFFATDYAVNKQLYQNDTEILIRLSAFILELFDKSMMGNELNSRPSKSHF